MSLSERFSTRTVSVTGSPTFTRRLSVAATNDRPVGGFSTANPAAGGKAQTINIASSGNDWKCA